jgi:hypothetical protein
MPMHLGITRNRVRGQPAEKGGRVSVACIPSLSDADAAEVESRGNGLDRRARTFNPCGLRYLSGAWTESGAEGRTLEWPAGKRAPGLAAR